MARHEARQAPDPLAARLRALEDRAEIYDCIVRYARGMDRLDRALVLSAYHLDAVEEHGQFVGGIEAFVDWAFAMHASVHVSTQHGLLQHSAEIDGDVAHAETYYRFVSLNTSGSPWSMVAGRYIDRFERSGGRWGIARRVVVRDWTTTDVLLAREDLLTVAAGHGIPDDVRAVMTRAPAARRDRRDPSYDRPLEVPEERVAASQAVWGDGARGVGAPRA